MKNLLSILVSLIIQSALFPSGLKGQELPLKYKTLKDTTLSFEEWDNIHKRTEYGKLGKFSAKKMAGTAQTCKQLIRVWDMSYFHGYEKLRLYSFDRMAAKASSFEDWYEFTRRAFMESKKFYFIGMNYVISLASTEEEEVKACEVFYFHEDYFTKKEFNSILQTLSEKQQHNTTVTLK